MTNEPGQTGDQDRIEISDLFKKLIKDGDVDSFSDQAENYVSNLFKPSKQDVDQRVALKVPRVKFPSRPFHPNQLFRVHLGLAPIKPWSEKPPKTASKIEKVVEETPEVKEKVAPDETIHHEQKGTVLSEAPLIEEEKVFDGMTVKASEDKTKKRTPKAKPKASKNSEEKKQDSPASGKVTPSKKKVKPKKDLSADLKKRKKKKASSTAVPQVEQSDLEKSFEKRQQKLQDILSDENEGNIT